MSKPNEKQVRLQIAVALWGWVGLASCGIATADGSPSPSPAATSLPIEQQATTETVAEGPDELATLSALRSMPKLTPSPSRTVVLTPAPPWYSHQLTDHHPTQEDVEAFLGDDVKDLYFEDVSGDGQTDLIVSSEFWSVYILLWQEDHFGPPTVIGPDDGSFKANAGMHVSFKDWTGDGVPEVVYETVRDTGGTALFIRNWDTKIVHCDAETSRCWTVWSGWTASLGDLAVTGGMHYYRSTLSLVFDAGGRPVLRQVYTGFVVYGLPPYAGSGWAPVLNEDYALEPEEAFQLIDKLYLDVGMVFDYAWDGSMFGLINEQVVSLPNVIGSQSRLRAVGAGAAASVKVKRWPMGDFTEFENDACQLYIGGEAVGGAFGCKYNFTFVDWQDLTNDGAPEVVVKTVSGCMSGMEESGWEPLSEKGCFHQRLLAYAWDGTKATLLANINGCVRRPDLFGVAVEDYDGDGQLEILAADRWFLYDQCEDFEFCWHELSQLYEIYEWDGQAFVSSR